MSIDSQLLAALLGLLGGVFGGVPTVWAMLRIERKADATLEIDEVRKLKVGIIYDLLGSRYVLNSEYAASSNEVQVFNTAMALFSVYFANDREVAKAYDRFLNDRSNQNLFDMLKLAARHADLDLLDTQIAKVMSVNPRTFILSVENPNAVRVV